ncbi:MAG: hypothetical protein AAFS10_10180 [Myxococcota bacterium]
MSVHKTLSALRSACHTRDARAVARLLATAALDDVVAWSYAEQHGLAPVDWSTTDRHRFCFVPATQAHESCLRCAGRGYRDRRRGSRRRCSACWGSGALEEPTAPLWVSRGHVTRADWWSVVGAFPAEYQRWLELPQNHHRWRRQGRREVIGNRSGPGPARKLILAPDQPFEMGGAEPFLYCNALSQQSPIEPELCYRLSSVQEQANGPSPHTQGEEQSHTLADRTVVCRVASLAPSPRLDPGGGGGFRLPTPHERRALGQLALSMEGLSLGYDLCWAHCAGLDRRVILVTDTPGAAVTLMEYERPDPLFTRAMAGLRVVRQAPMASHTKEDAR